MTKSAQRILEEALTLKDADREELIERLADTLKPSTDADYIAAWQAEIQARIQQVERGEVTPIPWKEAIDQIGRGEGDGE